MLIELLNELEKRSIEEIENLQDFHVFTGHSYDRYLKMVKNGILKGSVTNIRTDRTFKDEEVASLLLGYLDNELPSIVLYQLVSHFEGFFFDFLSILLKTNPHALSQDRQVKVRDIIQENDMDSLIDHLIHKELLELKYRGVDDWFVFLEKIIKLNDIHTSDISRISEIKATRDILAHNEGIVNEIYLRKSGDQARASKGQLIPINRKYSYGSADFLKDFIRKITGNAVLRLESS